MQELPHLPLWTAALVLAELRAQLRRPVIVAPPRLAALLEPDDALPPPDLLALATLYLGKRSDRLEALLIVARGAGPGRPKIGAPLSIRERCQERAGVACHRSTVYRRALAGARIVAERLNADGLAPPAR